MQCLTGRITVTGLSIEFSSAKPYKIQEDFHKSTSIPAIALFWNQSDGGYISKPFVEKAFGSPVPCGHNGNFTIVPTTWRLAIFDKGGQTSYLRVVSELDYDVVLGQGAGCGNWKSSVASQQPLFNSFNHMNTSWQGWLKIAAVVEQLLRLGSSELEKKFEDVQFVKSFALSCGLILEEEMSIKTWADIFCQRIEAIKLGRQPAVDDTPSPARTAPSDLVSNSEETESSVSSESDVDDLVYEGSTTSSEMSWGRNVHQRPSFLSGISHTYTENVCTPSVQSTQVTRESSPGSWQFVENPSPQPMIEVDSPALVGGTETEEYGNPSLDQGHTSDFDAHPGHKEWEWDKDRQRWKRRGRSGLEETDWFPESFA